MLGWAVKSCENADIVRTSLTLSNKWEV